MAGKKETTKTEKIEREYVIPLREKCRSVPRYKKTNKAVKSVKEFLVKHMKIRDRDLDKIKLDIHLNEFLWSRGIRSPPHKVKVKAVKEGDIVNVELVDYTDKLKFKKARLEKREQSATTKKKPVVKEETSKEEVVKTEGERKEEQEKKNEFEEDKASVIEEGEKISKEKAKIKQKVPKVKSPEQIEGAIKEPIAK